jgi:hypothetical protein
LITTSTGPQGGFRVAAQTFHNLNISHAFGPRHRWPYLRRLSVQFTLNNVLGTEPAFDAGNNRAPFFYSRYGSIRLRDYILRVKRDF